KGNFWLAENTETPNKGWDAALPRICTWGLFKDKQTGFEFFLFNAHFDHVGVEARKESARLIVEKAHALGAGIPMIIMGDFNVDQHNRSEEHTSELQSRENLVYRPLLEKKKQDILLGIGL